MISSKTTNIVNKLYKLSFCIFLLLMFLFPTPALAGAKRGLLLWFNTVLPTLLPFIILSTLIVRLGIAYSLCNVFYPVIGRIFHVTKNACYPIIMGFLSGIPLGAKTSADLVKEKRITKDEGQFLAIMCNNASPMFVLGYVAMSELNAPKMKLPIILLLYGSSILTALLCRQFYPILCRHPYEAKLPIANSELNKKVYAQSEDITPAKSRSRFKIDFTIIDSAIMDGFDVITKIGGYIILFSVLTQIILSIEPLHEAVRFIFVGILEITTGIDTVATSGLTESIKIVLILCITSFGGFSGIAQTKSVFADSGLSIIFYIKAKLLNTFVTLCLALLYVKIFL